MVSGAKNLMIFINGPLLLNLKCFSRNDHDLDDDTTSTSAVDPVSTPGPSQTNQPEKPFTAASPNWHLIYKLPSLPSSLEVKLTTGQHLKEPERSVLLEAIYNSVKIYI